MTTVLVLGLATGTTNGQDSVGRASVRLRATLAGHTKSISDIRFSPSGKTLVTVSLDGAIRLWDVGTGETRAALKIAEKHRLSSLRWSRDELLVAGYSARGWSSVAEVRVWDARTGELKVAFDPGHASYIMGFDWSPDGRVLLTAGEDGVVKLWDAATGRLMHTLGQDPRSPDETDSLWKSIFTHKRLADMRLTSGYFDAAGQSVLTLSYTSSPKLWDAASGKLKTVLPLSEEHPDAKYPSYPTNALLSPDRRLVVRRDDEGVTLLDTATGQVKRALGHIGSPMEFSPDGRSLLVAVREAKFKWRGGEDTLRLYDVETGQLRLTFENVPEGVQDIYWSPDGGRLVAGGWARTNPRVLDTRTGRVTARLPYGSCTPDSWVGDGDCEPFRFSADGRVVFKQRNPLKLWSAETGQLLAKLEDVTGSAEFSPTDKQLLVTRGKDKKTALLWEVSLK